MITMMTWLIYFCSLLYMEVVFHLGSFHSVKCNPLFMIGAAAFVAALQTLISDTGSKKRHKACVRFFLGGWFVLFGAQTVYYHIFRQPLLLTAVLMGAQDALTNFWREALTGFVQVLWLLALLAVPLPVAGILRRTQKWRPRRMDNIRILRVVVILWTALIYCVCCIRVGLMVEADFAEEYSEYYDPCTVMERMGVLTVVQRDLVYELQKLTGGTDKAEDEDPESPFESSWSQPEESATGDPFGSESSGEDESSEPSTEIPVEPVLDTSPNMFQLDLAKLAELSGTNKETKWLAEYFAGVEPTNRNEYTGMFAGYNLIFLTAEGFSTYAVREDLTPTLYKMLHSSFVFENYYVPLWQTSTSDGEYVNCTGLIPDGQFSMRKSAEKNMAFSLPKFFAKEGVGSRAYHNNTLTYYDRYKTHPNLGYDFKATKLGEASAAEWGDHIFQVEHPNAWPASDYEMMVSTIPEYINDERFHTYYMTVSGHMNYNFSGNQMASWNKEAVKDLPLSENARAYLACNLELEKAMTYLLEQLEAAGKLENTVICLSADHYPYGMTEEQYEELAGKDLSQGCDYSRNSLILWNGGMEEPVIVEKPCCSVDILPTLLNLFGFDYDSRMYAGRDILSTQEGLVIFKDQSFVTDIVEYNKKSKQTIWHEELTDEEKESYLAAKKKEVKNRYLFSAYILRNDYYSVVEQCITP